MHDKVGGVDRRKPLVVPDKMLVLARREKSCPGASCFGGLVRLGLPLLFRERDHEVVRRFRIVCRVTGSLIEPVLRLFGVVWQGIQQCRTEVVIAWHLGRNWRPNWGNRP